MLVTLNQADLPRLQPLLDAAPLDALFLASRVERFGLDADKLGCPVIGVVRGDKLVAAVHAGANLMAVGDADALAEVVEQMGPRIRTQSILGPSHLVNNLYTGLVQRWGTSWAQVRDMRAHQPLMVYASGTPVPVAPDSRVRVMTLKDLDAYYAAAVRMYKEEVGSSPEDVTDSYRTHVRDLVGDERSFGACESGRVWFKADVGASYRQVCQVQGVWIDPAVRGHGLAEPAMAAVLRLIGPRWSTVSLYVNDYNVRARHMYDRLGFRVVGEFATVLY